MWSPDCEDIFRQLKQLLTNAPILRIADLKNDLLVYKNACNDGLSGLLMQGQVVCYESQSLNEHE
jgi:hypothetical protein